MKIHDGTAFWNENRTQMDLPDIDESSGFLGRCRCDISFILGGVYFFNNMCGLIWRLDQFRKTSDPIEDTSIIKGYAFLD